MENNKELPFDGFKKFIQDPLESGDRNSFEYIKTFFLNKPTPIFDPFNLLIQKLTGKIYRGKEAKEHWIKILNHKQEMQAKLGRRVSITTAAIDYFDSIKPNQNITNDYYENVSFETPHEILNANEWINRVYSPNYHLEKLKEEIMRAKRYKHALSAIILDIDNFSHINEKYSFKTGDNILTLVVKIIKKTIRSVDIMARYSGDKFLIILPNTNKREALELAERLRININQRTAHLINNGITVTMAVSQASSNENSLEFLKSLSFILEEGKKKSRNSVHVCDK
jgi:diguanylate cyclase (GGDEF)-like protein